MNDYGLSVLPQYGLENAQTRRTRGALLCKKEGEVFLLKAFYGSQRRLSGEQQLLTHITENSRCQVDVFVENQEGELVSRDKDGVSYTLQKWYEGRECDTKSSEDISRSAAALAQVHMVMELPVIPDYQAKSLEEEYERHNRELKKIWKYVRRKGASNAFEKLYLSSVEYFLERGEAALEELKASGYRSLREEAARQGRVCHGEFNQHNVLMLRQGAAITNFSKWNFDIQTADLYRFLRKILEKYRWDSGLAQELLREYEQIRPLSGEELENLRIRFLYPEKYWKLANYYFSHNKVWISGKNVEKLENLVNQRELWEKFCKKSFRKHGF